ncbi:lipoprotein [Spiroplasma cantharicola]|uniref:Lipoprotein n=1 Tax=Spiroplasma cantharicola TaxID=362837 RepID=A0A0M4KCT2_9MOLU|nr:lipoprotein [Spiroplasma cantharicola]ALD66590.1 hypothetical protein SCANT_v1c06840 [Spiroplasma cantharicola]
MKKLLGLLGAAGLVATTSATVVACGGEKDKSEDLSLEFKEIKAQTAKINIGKKTDKAVVKSESDAKDKSILEVSTGEVAENGEVVVTVTPKEIPTDKDVNEVLTITYGVVTEGKQEILTTTKIKVTVKKGEVVAPELVEIATHVTKTTLKISEVKDAAAYLVDVKKDNANLVVEEVTPELTKAPVAEIPGDGDAATVPAVDGELTINVNKGSKVYKEGKIKIILSWTK